MPGRLAEVATGVLPPRRVPISASKRGPAADLAARAQRQQALANVLGIERQELADILEREGQVAIQRS